MKSKDVFQKAGQMTASIAGSAVNQAEHHAEALYLGIGAMSGPLGVLACVACSADGEETPRMSGDHFLFAALLACAALHIDEQKDMRDLPGIGEKKVAIALDMSCDFGPDTVLDAMAQFEKLTGRKPDSFLNQKMVQATREAADTGKVMLADLLKRGPQAPSTTTKQ